MVRKPDSPDSGFLAKFLRLEGMGFEALFRKGKRYREAVGVLAGLEIASSPWFFVDA